jgi:hypothetical protein
VDTTNLKGGSINTDTLNQLKTLGVSIDKLSNEISLNLNMSYDRWQLYYEVTKSLDHWMMSSATELYADFATTYSPMNNATVWITGESRYVDILTKLINDLGIEEKIFDWAYNVGAFGDLFIKVNAAPEFGIISIDDNRNPLEISRADYNGDLIGFYETPAGIMTGSNETNDRARLIAPWEYVHLRLLGVKRRRPLSGDPMNSEFRSLYILNPDNRQISSKYGTTLLINGLATYKRLKLAEDSLLLARVTRGTIKYLYKLKVDGTNMEAVNELVDLYSQTLKKARALNTNPNALNYDEKANSLTVMEDLFIPVWGDVGDLTVEKIGEDADIRWIVDIEELRNQLSCALRCPLSLLGGYTKEASGTLGSEAMEQLDYRFARSARRLQRALINGITKLCQIHLAYKNLDPDPKLFQVCMSETSTAEEEHVRKSLESGITTVRSILDIAKEVDKNADFVGMFDYLNDKILKLQGFNLKDFASNSPKKEKKVANVVDHVENKDLHGFLPLKEGKSKFISYTMNSWEEKYKNAEIIVTKETVKK